MATNIDNSPKISVVMSVFNGSKYINDSIDSILNQTFKDFEFIIIDDGSTDDSLEKIKSYNDSRIVVISRENKGLVYSLNQGISIAKGKYIVRQDADDISSPTRFEEQFHILTNNPKLILVGSSIYTIDEESKTKNMHKVLINNPELKQELIIRSPFAHGSTMFKKSLFITAGGYKSNEWPTEDYGLWLRMAEYGDFFNIDSPLYKYRENSLSISNLNKDLQKTKTLEINKTAQLKYTKLLTKINTNYYKSTKDDGNRIDRILDNLIFGIRISIKYSDYRAIIRSFYYIVSDSFLFRKFAQRLLIRLRLKNA
jgi:glycosyltransferase involved in cell wall biosynthesis